MVFGRFPRRACLALGLALTLAEVRSAEASTSWPPLHGEVGGNLQLPSLPELPAVAWKVNVAPTADGKLRLVLIATAPGLTVTVEAVPPLGDDAGTWRVTDGSADLKNWTPTILARLADSGLPADLALNGVVHLTGGGTWRGSGFEGTLRVALDDGHAQSDQQQWEVTGLAGSAELVIGPEGMILRSAQAGAEMARVAGVTAHRLNAEVVAEKSGQLNVRTAELEIFGGRIALTPFLLDPGAPAVATTAEFSGVALEELAKLAPQALAEARGQVAGRISVHWSAKLGFEPGEGALTALNGGPTTVRLAPEPGFLTQHVPARIALLPDWLGPISRWFAPENPAYDTLRRIETGQLPLNVENLQVQLYPDGPDGPRSAVVELSAHPEGDSMVKRVSFTVNVAGPLSQVLQLSFKDGVNMKVNAEP